MTEWDGHESRLRRKDDDPAQVLRALATAREDPVVAEAPYVLRNRASGIVDEGVLLVSAAHVYLSSRSGFDGVFTTPNHVASDARHLAGLVVGDSVEIAWPPMRQGLIDDLPPAVVSALGALLRIPGDAPEPVAQITVTEEEALTQIDDFLSRQDHVTRTANVPVDFDGDPGWLVVTSGHLWGYNRATQTLRHEAAALLDRAGSLVRLGDVTCRVVAENGLPSMDLARGLAGLLPAATHSIMRTSAPAMEARPVRVLAGAAPVAVTVADPQPDWDGRAPLNVASVVEGFAALSGLLRRSGEHVRTEVDVAMDDPWHGDAALRGYLMSTPSALFVAHPSGVAVRLARTEEPDQTRLERFEKTEYVRNEGHRFAISGGGIETTTGPITDKAVEKALR